MEPVDPGLELTLSDSPESLLEHAYRVIVTSRSEPFRTHGRNPIISYVKESTRRGQGALRHANFLTRNSELRPKRY